MENITFEGKWVKNWFSNMIECPITINDITYRSVENYYQAMKSLNVEEHKKIAVMTPSKSKYYTRSIKIREDWINVKETFMFKGLWEKFNIPQWKEKLLNTGNDPIIEWNNWGDVYWGKSIYTNKGENHLGVLLMEIREKLRNS